MRKDERTGQGIRTLGSRSRKRRRQARLQSASGATNDVDEAMKRYAEFEQTLSGNFPIH